MWHYRLAKDEENSRERELARAVVKVASFELNIRSPEVFLFRKLPFEYGADFSFTNPMKGFCRGGAIYVFADLPYPELLRTALHECKHFQQQQLRKWNDSEIAEREREAKLFSLEKSWEIDKGDGSYDSILEHTKLYEIRQRYSK